MKVYRTIDIETNQFKLGDVISFTLLNGEDVEAMAMQKDWDGMIFCTVDCLTEEYPMNWSVGSNSTYSDSDLRDNLNNEILNLFPQDIRKQMVTFANGDYLRIPTEKEIFGRNVLSECEGDDVQQWIPMMDTHNRIGFRGKKTGIWEFYWLQNSVEHISGNFMNIDNYGSIYFNDDYDMAGVRLVFKI